MKREQIKQMIDRYNREIDHARTLLEWGEQCRFVLRGEDDNRPDDELIQEQISMHQRLIDNYSRQVERLTRWLHENR